MHSISEAHWISVVVYYGRMRGTLNLSTALVLFHQWLDLAIDDLSPVVNIVAKVRVLSKVIC